MKKVFFAILALGFSFSALAVQPGIYSTCEVWTAELSRKVVLEIGQDMKFSHHNLSYRNGGCKGEPEYRGKFGPLVVQDEEITGSQWKTTVLDEGSGFFIKLEIEDNQAFCTISPTYPVEMVHTDTLFLRREQ